MTADSFPVSLLGKETALRALPKVGGEEVTSPQIGRTWSRKSSKSAAVGQAKVPGFKVFDSTFYESGSASLSHYEQALAKTRLSGLLPQSSVDKHLSSEKVDDKDRVADSGSWTFDCLHPETGWDSLWWYYIMFMALACAVIQPCHVSLCGTAKPAAFNMVFSLVVLHYVHGSGLCRHRALQRVLPE
eukprot:gene4379-14504_t